MISSLPKLTTIPSKRPSFSLSLRLYLSAETQTPRFLSPPHLDPSVFGRVSNRLIALWQTYQTYVLPDQLTTKTDVGPGPTFDLIGDDTQVSPVQAQPTNHSAPGSTTSVRSTLVSLLHLASGPSLHPPLIIQHYFPQSLPQISPFDVDTISSLLFPLLASCSDSALFPNCD